jgi:hypothetical protein
MPTTVTHVWRPSGARRVTLDGFGPIARGTTQSVPVPLSWPAKDPSDVLDYEFDIAAALAGNDGDVISAVNVSVTPAGTGDMVANSVVADGSLVVIWFAGGIGGTVYFVQIAVGTSSGRSISRVVRLPCLALASATQSALALTTDQGSVITDQFGNPILLGS